MNSQASSKYDSLVEHVLAADRLCVLTGAGVSKESGVPTFRDVDGLWNKFRPEELANVNAFLANPRMVWEWYDWRRSLMAEVSPNPGHFALVELEKIAKHFVLITQNVDNMHHNAGNQNIIELHGNIQRNKCFDCGAIFDGETDLGKISLEGDHLPECPVCGGRLRPDVVWFGENLSEEVVGRAWHEAETCDLFMSIGTSAVVYPAAMLPQIAKAAGAYLVEINPATTPLSPMADVVILEPSGEALPKLLKAVEAARGAQ